MATNGTKPCVSLVNDAKAVEDAAMVLDDHLEKIQEQHGLSQRDLAPLRLVSNVLTNVSNLVKRSVKALSPGGGDPEWVNKRKEKDRKLQKLKNGPIPRSYKSKSKPRCRSIELYNRQKENDGREPTRKSTSRKPKYAPPVPSRTRYKPKKTPLIPTPSNGFEYASKQ